jgi:quercetin dioxygenase-like cupin family protein
MYWRLFLLWSTSQWLGPVSAPNNDEAATRWRGVECRPSCSRFEAKHDKEEGMKRSVLVVGVAMVLVLAWSIGRGQGQPGDDKVVFVESSKASFSAMPGGNASVKTAPIWGDAGAGAFAAFTKFSPGYDAGWHTHTNDVSLVVIKGAYLYKDEAGEKRVGPGDFLRVPGGHKHWSGGDKKEGALFYDESPGKFDLIPAK